LSSVPPAFDQKPIEEPKIDRTPSGFTQPKTTAQLVDSNTKPTSPFVSNQKMKDNGEDQKEEVAKNQTESSTPSDNDFEDEFEIPAFLRQ